MKNEKRMVKNFGLASLFYPSPQGTPSFFILFFHSRRSSRSDTQLRYSAQISTTMTMQLIDMMP